MTARRKSGPRGETASGYLTVRIAPSARDLLRGAAEIAGSVSFSDWVLDTLLEQAAEEYGRHEPRDRDECVRLLCARLGCTVEEWEASG